MSKIACFKAYDIRGKVPGELNTELAYKVGRTYAQVVNPKTVVVGYDVRPSSVELCAALSAGLNDAGVDVINIGLCGTEMIYFSTAYLETDGGVMITASHNPPEYNGLKFVKKGSVPMGYDSGLNLMEELITSDKLAAPAEKKGVVIHKDISTEFINRLAEITARGPINPYNVVVNPGNGALGPVLDLLKPVLPINMVPLFMEPDSTFPNGVPNPMLEENRDATTKKILESGADLGVAWDGDYDRCFFFDEKGNFIEGYYIVALLAKSILQAFPGEKIIHDPRLTWNTIEVVTEATGTPVQSKSGHAFIKEKMREVNAIYGGEMSAHHYFRENAYSDSGLIPFILVLQLMTKEGKKLSELVEAMIQKYPCSGEINSVVADAAAKIAEIDALYTGGAREYVDGLSVDYGTWRFNLRMSNTEPIIRLNVETRADSDLMKQKTEELLAVSRR